MVNLGPSKGCRTCKERRVKCDEGKPACQRCLRLGRECGGYQKKVALLKFKEQKINYGPVTLQRRSSPSSSSTSSSTPSKQRQPRQQNQHPNLTVSHSRSGRRTPMSSSPSPVPSDDDMAVSFFLRHFCVSNPRNLYIGGFCDTLPSVLALERRDSPLYAAVVSVSSWVLTFWKDGLSNRKPHEWHVRAIEWLRTAIRDPRESQRQSTILAAFVLQLYDDLSALGWLREAPRLHYDGAVALLKRQSTEVLSSPYWNRMTSHVLHVEVASAIQEKRHFPLSEFSWIQLDLMPLNSNTGLDIIGITIADLQSRFLALMEQNDASPIAEQDLDNLLLDMEDAEAQLLDWQSNVPDHWHPSYSQQVKLAEPPITSYGGDCDIYPSLQIAATWNDWRNYRILLFEMTIGILDRVPPTAFSYFDVNKRAKMEAYARSSTQDMVDSLCRSIPFHLGNRFFSGCLDDLNDPSIVVPSYYDLEFCSDNLFKATSEENLAIAEAYRRHVIGLGPWHISVPLCNLIRMISEPFGSFIARSLRPGQLDFVREELIRASMILQIEAPELENAKKWARGMPVEHFHTDPLDLDAVVAKMSNCLCISSGL
ncbi:unnamed protein product [Clonostachys rhizophaga]|uniref:Zn(2)-C6 fungal-type domain-containing protein n=1 Tax=Clonostachys rhizophaga TaxID=160324 RepID=A0A9N9W1U8_9HYPO|nr:unnamed protein product [Clonostachys rhizophaga]